MELAAYINKDLAKARLARTKLLNQKKEILKELEMLEKEMVNIGKKNGNISKMKSTIVMDEQLLSIKKLKKNASKLQI